MAYSPPFLFPVRLGSTQPGIRSQAGARPSGGPSEKSGPYGRLRIVALDDHPAIRDAIRDTVDAEPDMEICGAVPTVQEAIQIISSEHADVAIVDINLGGVSGLEVVSALRLRFPELRIVVFSMFDEAAFGQRAIEAGAAAYVTKTAPTRSVIDAIRAVAYGAAYRANAPGTHRRGRLPS
jgi:DNA-binding NarL/FixJ family response regulator